MLSYDFTHLCIYVWSVFTTTHFSVLSVQSLVVAQLVQDIAEMVMFILE